MLYKEALKSWVLEAIDSHGGEANLIKVARHIWDNHEDDLRRYGEAFYTWQYDMRWAAQFLRDSGILSQTDQVPRGVWRRQKVAA